MIAILGSGGHAKCAYDCFIQQGQEVLGFFDDDKGKRNKVIINGVKVFGSTNDIERYSAIDSIFIAIGDNNIRIEKYKFYAEKKYAFPNALHVRSFVSEFASIGLGNFIMGAAMINAGSNISNYCIINTNATVGHDCILESGVQIGPGVNIAGGCVIEKKVFIGIGSKIGPEITIGARSIIGAGSVVLDNIPPDCFAFGVPAKVIKNI